MKWNNTISVYFQSDVSILSFFDCHYNLDNHLYQLGNIIFLMRCRILPCYIVLLGYICMFITTTSVEKNLEDKRL